MTHLCFYLVVQNFKTQFSWKKNSKKCTSFEEQKGICYIRGNVYFDITISRCLLSTKLYLEFLFICFAWEKKGVNKILWGNRLISRTWCTFHQKLGSRLKFQKTKTRFCRWKSNDYTTLISVTGKPFYLLACERKDLQRLASIFKTNSKL